MRLQDLLTMFGDELDEVARLNQLEDRTEAVEAKCTQGKICSVFDRFTSYQKNWTWTHLSGIT